MLLRIVCDLDNTIVDSGKRMDTIEGKYGIDNWTQEAVIEFVEPSKIAADGVIEKGVIIINSLIKKYNSTIYFITGRSEIARPTTLAWLNNNLWNISDSQLLMRSNKTPDMKPSDVKEGHIQRLLNLDNFDKNTMWIFFDDDPKCIEMYSKFGLSFKAPECWDYLNIK